MNDNFSGATGETKRQGEGGGRGANRRAMDLGSTAQPDFLLAGGAPTNASPNYSRSSMVRTMRVYKVSRRELFERLEKAALKPLPSQRFTYGEWKRATVNIDYHIEIAGHYYSVHYGLIHEECGHEPPPRRWKFSIADNGMHLTRATMTWPAHDQVRAHAESASTAC